MALKITKGNYNEEVLNSKEPVIIDFWASWCGPCRIMGPIIDDLASEANGFKVGKVNVDEEPELASAYGIMSIPTIVVVKNGKVTAQRVGVTQKNELLSLI